MKTGLSLQTPVTRLVLDLWGHGLDVELRLAAPGSLSTIDVRCVVADMARALAHLHGQGLLHTDVKPANVLVRRGNNGLMSKLADYGSCVEALGADPHFLCYS